MKKRIYRWGAGLGAIALCLATLTGCDENASLATPTSMCGYLVGNGAYRYDNAHSRDIGKILGPGQTAEYKNTDWDPRYFPCSSRNYVIAQNGGDTQVALNVRTKDGTAVNVYVSVYWTPNRSRNALDGDPLARFIEFCEKYNCAADNPDASAQGTNFSTAGWNGMLKENMWPTLQRVAETALGTVGDDIWKVDSRTLKDQAAGVMQQSFASAFQVVSGFTTNLICGSGSSGEGDKFDCQQVRIVVDKVFAAQGNMQQAADAAAEEAAKIALQEQQKVARINLTNELYGPLAQAFRACQDLGQLCKFVVGPGGNVQVQVG